MLRTLNNVSKVYQLFIYSDLAKAVNDLVGNDPNAGIQDPPPLVPRPPPSVTMPAGKVYIAIILVLCNRAL